METLILGLVVALNLIVIKLKFDYNRVQDAIFDLLALSTITYFTSGSFAALMVGTVASLIVSVFLYFSPPKLFGST